MNEHCAGRAAGAIPQQYLTDSRLSQCSVCGFLVSTRYNGAHPRCRPAARSTLRPTSSTTAAPNAPHASPNPPNAAGAAAQNTVTDLSNVLERKVNTLKFVPKAARFSWAQCVALTAAAVVWHNNEQAWTEWHMLAKSVLWAPPRQDATFKQQLPAIIRRRCERWIAGERAQLWSECLDAPARKGKRRDLSFQQREERATCFAREGLFSKACTALQGTPPLERTPEVTATLKTKHPRAASPPDLSDVGPASPAAVPDLDSDLVTKQVRSFSKGAAAGPSGLRPQHLKDAFSGEHSDEVREQLAALVNLLARGEAPASIAECLAGATLIALEKKDGGVRPIAVGDTLRRLVGKCLCEQVKAKALAHLWPLQIGVATRLGAEVGSQTTDQWLDRNRECADKVLVTIDFENAFNTVDRGVFLHEVRNRLPGLSAWAEWCYSRPSKLFYDGVTIPSEVGVQQGDPLGPLLFSLALQPVLAELAARSDNDKLELSFSYLDDAVLAGEQGAVARALARLSTAAAAVGLRLNASKCELVPASGRAASITPGLFPSEFVVREGRSLKLLGAPIGDEAFCTGVTEKRTEKAQPLLDSIAGLTDPQVALLLLRQCASFGKLVYSARTTKFDLHKSALDHFDATVRACFESFSGIQTTDSQWARATLATSGGGLGLRSVSEHAAAAYLASRSACHNLCRDLDPNHVWEVEDPTSAAAAAVTYVNNKVSAEDAVPPAVPDKLQQKQLSKAIDAAVFADLSAAAPPGCRAHLSLQKKKGSGSCFVAPPTENTQSQVTPPLFRGMLCRRLRVPFTDAPFFVPSATGSVIFLAITP